MTNEHGPGRTGDLLGPLTELRVSPDKRHVVLAFGSREERLSAEFLRVSSRSAEVRGHGNDAPAPVTGKRDVTIRNIEPVGRYAVKLTFSDGHDTGLYTFDYLADLAAEHEARWADHLRRLEAEGGRR